MFAYLGLAAAACVAAILLRPLGKPYGILVSLAAGIAILSAGLALLPGIVTEIKSWSSLLGDGADAVGYCLKLAGTALLTETACGLCRQAEEEELAKKCAFTGRVVLLSMALPALRSLLETLSSFASWS